MRPEPLLLFPLLLLPNNFKRTLDFRQSCPAGEKICGQYCIANSDSCCPDRSGGCPSGKYCSLGDNNQYGCCPNNKVCSGNGGATATGTDYYTSIYTGYSSATDSSSPTSATALGCDSYTITADADSAMYSVWCDKNYRGADDLSNIIAWRDGLDSMHECVNRCAQVTDCIAVDLYVEPYPGFPAGRCYLLSNISPGYNNKVGVQAASSIADSAGTSSTSLSVSTPSPLPSNVALSSSTTSAAATTTVTASSVAAGRSSQPYEHGKGLAWLACSTATAVTVFLAMIWL